jgi:hypothetical protein
MDISFTELHLNWTENVENTGEMLFTPLSKVRSTQRNWVEMIYTEFYPNRSYSLKWSMIVTNPIFNQSYPCSTTFCEELV